MLKVNIETGFKILVVGLVLMVDAIVVAQQPCVADYPYTDPDSGTQYKVFDTLVDYNTAFAQCQGDGATLPIIHTIVDAVKLAKARAALHTVLHQNDDIWLGIKQISQYVYEWDDGVRITLNPVTGHAEDGAYEHFYSEEQANLLTTFSDDDDHCLYAYGRSLLYRWNEKPCDNTESFVCVCN